MQLIRAKVGLVFNLWEFLIWDKFFILIINLEETFIIFKLSK
jgi:hypothetical protein